MSIPSFSGKRPSTGELLAEAGNQSFRNAAEEAAFSTELRVG